MGSEQSSDIAEWVVAEGLRGASQTELLQGYCERLVGAGVPLMRAHISQRALHPVYGGVGLEWHRDKGPAIQQDYVRDSIDTERWLRSPFRYMLENQQFKLRFRLAGGNEPTPYPALDELRAHGATDYFAQAVPFGAWHDGEPDLKAGPPQGIVTSWTTDAEGGFGDGHIATIERLLPTLAMVLKWGGTDRIARDLLSVYLGRDAGRRVLSGEIQRGSVETIRAVIWFCDLQGFTRIADTSPGEALITLLNDYFEAIVETLHGHGGQVLKFMGDGLLAIFPWEGETAVCRDALDAAEDALGRIDALNAARGGSGLPVPGFSLALHLGEVMYGNIGSTDRLDFTVVGPAVNEASRIEAMSRPLERDVVISQAFAGAAGAERERLVSLGRYALRGVRKPQELFTLLPPEERAPGAEEEGR